MHFKCMTMLQFLCCNIVSSHLAATWTKEDSFFLPSYNFFLTTGVSGENSGVPLVSTNWKTHTVRRKEEICWEKEDRAWCSESSSPCGLSFSGGLIRFLSSLQLRILTRSLGPPRPIAVRSTALLDLIILFFLSFSSPLLSLISLWLKLGLNSLHTWRWPWTLKKKVSILYS